MPRLIWVFAGRTCHFVGFVMRQLNCSSKFEWMNSLEKRNESQNNKYFENFDIFRISIYSKRRNCPEYVWEVWMQQWFAVVYFTFLAQSLEWIFSLLKRPHGPHNHTLIFTLANNFLRWTYFGPTRFTHPWTTLVHARDVTRKRRHR